jgi:hypothetical protein
MICGEFRNFVKDERKLDGLGGREVGYWGREIGKLEEGLKDEVEVEERI